MAQYLYSGHFSGICNVPHFRKGQAMQATIVYLFFGIWSAASLLVTILACVLSARLSHREKQLESACKRQQVEG